MLNTDPERKKRFLLRMNPALWDDLNRWAAEEFRSVNAQIEFLLQKAVHQRRKGRSTPTGPSEDES